MTDVSPWPVRRFSHVVAVRDGLVDPESHEYADVNLVAPNHIEPGTGRILGLETAREQGASSGKVLVHGGDVIYSKIRPALNKATIAPSDCLASADMYALVPGPELLPRFLQYQLLAKPFLDFATEQSMRVAMPKINRDTLAAAPIVVPTIPEQRGVTEFLDRETGKIDALIAKQQDLVTTLRDRRESAVMAAVTGKGDADPKRDSGVRWIGEVPEHWQVGNIRRFAAMHSGHTPSRQVPEYWEDCAVPWFTLADVWQLRGDTRTYLGETSEKISELGLRHSSAELLPAGTVALSRTASVGFSGIMPVPMATSQDFWNWVCGPELLPEFLLRVFRAMRREMRSLMAGSTHQTIYKTDAASFVIPVPPLDEQQTIVDHLDEELRRMDGLVDRATALVEVLQERRAALITAAVTGKLDVTTYGKAG